MKRSSILKICTAVLAAAALLTPVSVKAETPEEARINAELQAAKLSQERTYLTDIYRAKEEELRVAKEYLAAAESLAKINPLFESEITPAKERVEKAEKAVERANAFLQIALETDEEAQESVTISANDKQLVGFVGESGELEEYFSVETTGSPRDPSAVLKISDFPEAYRNYAGYNIIARYYTTEKLKEVSEESDSAGRISGIITVDGEMPGGGYADQVAVEVIAAPELSFVFLWDEEGSLRVACK